MHNYLFPDTAYELIGFTKQEEILYAIVEQSYVTFTEPTDLTKVKSFLLHNGFTNTRNNDYFNADQSFAAARAAHDESSIPRNRT
jgi:Tfp pilus assembly protein PilE